MKNHGKLFLKNHLKLYLFIFYLETLSEQTLNYQTVF